VSVLGCRGLTLIELLVVLALTVVVLAVVLVFSPLGTTAWERNAALSEAQQHARIAMEELSFELAHAYYVEVNQPQQVITYKKKVDGEQKLYKAYLSGRQLLINLPEGTAVPVASGIDALLVEPGGVLEAGCVVSFTLVASSDGHQVVMSSSVLPRNIGEGGR
jgi:prepilin-type N-terminal cleavage/methylation domain-containing protein